VDRSSAVRELPVLHAVAIRLRDDGLSDHVIAVALEIDDDQVPMLLNIAERKLTSLMGSDESRMSNATRVDRPQTYQASQQKGDGGSS
jgi:hypothetical protein